MIREKGSDTTQTCVCGRPLPVDAPGSQVCGDCARATQPGPEQEREQAAAVNLRELGS